MTNPEIVEIPAPEDGVHFLELLIAFPDLNWLEDRGRFQRYAVGPEDSVWVCCGCDRVADPDLEDGENGCVCPEHQGGDQ